MTDEILDRSFEPLYRYLNGPNRRYLRAVIRSLRDASKGGAVVELADQMTERADRWDEFKARIAVHPDDPQRPDVLDGLLNDAYWCGLQPAATTLNSIRELARDQGTPELWRQAENMRQRVAQLMHEVKAIHDSRST